MKMAPRLFSAALATLAVGCTGKLIRPTTQDRITASPEVIARGNYLVNSVAPCGACHTPRVGDNWLGGERTDRYLAGGTQWNNPEGNFRILASNITQDRETGIGNWTDDEIMRATRDGVHRDGSLMWPPMPYTAWQHMSDDDTRAIVAYLRTVPPVKNRVDRADRKGPFMMKMAMKMGAMHHEPARNVKAPPVTDRKAYGGYLAEIGICIECHSMGKTGPDKEDLLMAGSKMEFVEPEYGKLQARNLTPDVETGLGKFSAAQIKESLKTGRRLDGKMMAPPMSLLIPHLSTWTESDLDALVAYMISVPAIKHAVPERQLTPEAKRLVGEP